MLAFEQATLGYGKQVVLSDVNLVLGRGDFLGVVGPNGAGKTTILKAMLGMLRPIAGQVQRDRSARFGYVPQRQFIDEVFPLSAADVALMGRYPLLGAVSRPSHRDRELVAQCLEHVGIAELADRLYRELSGGQKQRVLIARALAARPDALILDEPTNDMDVAGEYAIMELLRRFNKEDGITIVMVSHLLNVVASYARRLALIDGGLRVVGPAEEVLTSANLTGIYGTPVEVAECGGRRVIVVGEPND